MISKIDAPLFKNMVLSAANKLNANREEVNALNVFPVPDGDTGTNMGLTFMNAAKELDEHEYSSLSDAAAAVAKATLRGARGNSGVILSQIFRGISKGLKGIEAASAAELAASFSAGSNAAYSAVMKPTEGTILTVVRKCAQSACDYKGEDIGELFDKIIRHGNSALAKTTQMLPQLQQAGVVDAGGQGLMLVLEGFAEALDGKPVVLIKEDDVPKSAPKTTEAPEKAASDEAKDETKYIYCTELVVNKYNPLSNADSLRNAIEDRGDRMLIIDEGKVVKVHIHTDSPGYVLEQAVKLGEMTNIKIDNTRLRHGNVAEETAETEEKPSEPEKELSIVAVAAGNGLAEIFTNLGVDAIIEGGQTMNPSTEDILAAVNKVNAKNVIILPNNKNIVLSAEQVQYLTERKIYVVPSHSIPEGIAAAMAFSPKLSPDELFESMKAAVSNVKSGSVTFAVRDTSIDGMDISKGNYLGLANGKIASVGEALNETAFELVSSLADEDSEVISVYCGADTSEEVSSELEQRLSEAYPDADVLFYGGGQPVYYYIVSVE